MNVHAVVLRAFANDIKLISMQVDRIELRLFLVSCIIMALQQKRFAATSASNLKQLRTFQKLRRMLGNGLCAGVRNENFSLVKQRFYAWMKDALSVTNALAKIYQRIVDMHVK